MKSTHVRDLMVDACAGTLPAEDAQRLDEALAADPTLQAELLEQCQMHGLLRAETDLGPDLAPRIRQQLAGRLTWRRRLRRTAVLVAAAVVVLGFGWWAWLAPPPVDPGWGDVVAGGDALQAPPPSSRLQVGRTLLVAGPEDVRLRDRFEAEFTMAPGSQLRTTADGIELISGSVAVQVPPRPSASPLIINAPGARYRVEGTRFHIHAGLRVSRLIVDQGQVAVLAADGQVRQLVAGGEQTVQGHAPLPAPVLDLDFEGRDGRSVVDRSPLGHRVWVTRAPPAATGRYGAGLSCDTSRVLLVADHPALLPDRGSFCLWLQPRIPLPEHETVVPGLPVEFFSKADWESRSGLEVLRPAHGPERWGLRLMPGDGSTPQLMQPTVARTDWIHLALTWGDGQARMYIDGRPAGRGDLPPLRLPEVPGDARIGNNFLGVIDEVRLYQQALDQAQIEAVMLDAER